LCSFKGIEFPWPGARAVLQYHERLNGSGYPSGLTADDIIQAAHSLAVADGVEAMTSLRPYRPASGIDLALDEIARHQAILHDPRVVEVCIRLFRERNFTFAGEEQEPGSA
jgi:HD-GYP domain-containing protein (c-di-GMP phosphodiesterase class II)